MRFITEFELEPPKNYDMVLLRYKEYGKREISDLIEKTFGWDEKGVTTLTGPVKERYTLEIEAFPMDKWVEFKRRFFSHLGTTGLYDSTFKDLISELESFGKQTGTK